MEGFILHPEKKLKILFISAEVSPFAKTGGLADVAGSLPQALTELGLSARAHDKILRVARTIADLAGDEHLHAEHVSEAIMYRRLDRQL